MKKGHDEIPCIMPHCEKTYIIPGGMPLIPPMSGADPFIPLAAMTSSIRRIITAASVGFHDVPPNRDWAKPSEIRKFPTVAVESLIRRNGVWASSTKR